MQNAMPLGLADFSAENIRVLLTGFVQSTTRSAQYAELAGESTGDVYKARKAEVGRAIAILESTHTELCELERHSHIWNDDDYCSICGADGRA